MLPLALSVDRDVIDRACAPHPLLVMIRSLDVAVTASHQRDRGEQEMEQWGSHGNGLNQRREDLGDLWRAAAYFLGRNLST